MALFDGLDSALADIDTLQDYNLDRLIDRYDIDFQSVLLPADINGYSMPLTRTMFINQNAEYTDRVKAHELIHCLVDNSVEPLIEGSLVNGSKIERRADWGGFYLMVKEYQSLYDVEPEVFNIVNFCEFAHVPSKYFYTAADAAEKVFNITISDKAFYR
ncbi:hypothetical protein [Levilactobacillus enshiensis]|uniref:hypothetical protein n=1 Tax=Levilactobacillus enshiensis TaxID=2590213 RepID=UPI001179FF96|nr:hypothetical protein [Levilactobacillus enshiensis]